MSKKQTVINELHRSARKKYPRRKVIIKSLNDLWQADLVSMIPYARYNKGNKYILIVINAFSKYVWTRPIKTKGSEHVTKAMESILEEAKVTPKNLQTDLGTEFVNARFKKLMSDFNINHYSTFSNLKASIVERVNRTLKNAMWKKFSMRGSYKWIDILDEIVNEYNRTVHSTIGIKPINVSKKNEKELFKKVYRYTKIISPLKSNFKKGDFVRISKYREHFSKGYTPNWSNEIFIVKKIQLTNPITYLLEDQNRKEIQGGFYKEELQKVKYPDVYLVEKVLRRKGNNVFVKWLGLNKTHNSWIHKNNVL